MQVLNIQSWLFIRSNILNINTWRPITLDENLINGDQLYQRLIERIPNVPLNGYLTPRDLNVVSQGLNMSGRNFRFEASDFYAYGSMDDNIALMNEIGSTLENSIIKLFNNHSAGILVCDGRCIVILKSGEKYYLVDSHSHSDDARNSMPNGKACTVQCDTVAELVYFCKRATKNTNVEYSLEYVKVEEIKGK